MESVNPIAGSLAQSTVVSRQQSADKSQQIRRAQNLRKNVAATTSDDTFEHQVESTEELTPIHDEQKQNEPKRRRSKSQSRHTAGTDDNEHLDVTG